LAHTKFEFLRSNGPEKLYRDKQDTQARAILSSKLMHMKRNSVTTQEGKLNYGAQQTQNGRPYCGKDEFENRNRQIKKCDHALFKHSRTNWLPAAVSAPFGNVVQQLVREVSGTIKTRLCG